MKSKGVSGVWTVGARVGDWGGDARDDSFCGQMGEPWTRLWPTMRVPHWRQMGFLRRVLLGGVGMTGEEVTERNL